MLQHRIRVKMCGMTRQEDIEYAGSLGVDAIGLIFHPQSPRNVSLQQASELLQAMPAFMNVVAVMVNPTVSFVENVINRLPIHYLQFHGEESVAFCEQFYHPYIKAIQATSTEAIINADKCYTKAAALLLDTPSEKRGGTGLVFDWGVIPAQLNKPVILAGGLKSENVIAAIAQYTPYAVDVCSGIELAPAVKDHGKMKHFIQTLWETK